ncbi:tyrosine-type recombinase/integrase [Uniformispora flossi]|uniref:tyrosine-type recombinase/integrase n=1 Tax=Uniformispora flossi TaxID=3390723 RepID=UPI003C2C4DB4
MVQIYDRWHLSRPPDGAEPCREHSTKTKKLVPGSQHMKGKRWQVRYRLNGEQPKENFATYPAAESRAAEIKTELDRQTFVAPGAGKVTVESRARAFLAGLTNDPTTVRIWTGHVEAHIIPAFGDMEMRAVRPSTIQQVVKRMDASGLGPSTIRDILSTLSSIFNIAVEDGVVTKNPCRSKVVKPPTLSRRKAQPWPVADVLAVTEALPERYRSLPVEAFGCGLRQGEAFGLAVDDVDFLRREMHVRRQVKIVEGKLVFALPKGGKTRTVPLPEEVANRLSLQLSKVPAVEVTLPWAKPDGKEVTVRLITTTESGEALRRMSFNKTWIRALLDAEVTTAKVVQRRRTDEERAREGLGRTSDSRQFGMHALRHTYASVLLDAGESIRTLADYLGHEDPAFTLRTYTHLIPSSRARARAAVDRAFEDAADGAEETRSALDVPR